MKKHLIIIEEDGWVSVDRNDGTQIGLGDIGVDVFIKDLRTPARAKRAQLKRKAKALRKKGLTLRQIGKNLGISFETARQYII